MSTAITTHRFRLVPIDQAAADARRADGGISYIADSKPGYPCRQCMRDADIGEELILVSHDPFDLDSPYRGAGPIFLHAEPCTPWTDQDSLPSQLTVRQLSVRAFDAEAMMIDAAVIDGNDLHSTLDRMLDDADTDTIHVHNAVRGCWAVTVARIR